MSEAIERFENFLLRRKWLQCAAVGLLAGYALKFLILLTRHEWILDGSGQPYFHDFVWMWSGSFEVLHGQAANVYDQAQFAAVQGGVLQTNPGRLSFFHFVYPPTALLLVAPLALMPYDVAFVAWIGATLALYLRTIWLIIPGRTSLLLALAALAVQENIRLGQNGLLNASLVGLALITMEARPVFAGLCLGILTYKPQLALLFPVTLFVAKRWRVLFAALACAFALAFVATVAFGFPAWTEFARHLSGQATSSTLMPDQNLTAVQHSFYGLAIWLGAAPSAAWAAQAVGAIISLLAVNVLWRSAAPFAVKAAGLSLGIAAATPYLLFYDLALLSIPAALLIRHGLAEGFLPGERLGIAVCVLPQFFGPGAPDGLVMVAGMALLVFRRAFFHAETVVRPALTLIPS